MSSMSSNSAGSPELLSGSTTTLEYEPLGENEIRLLSFAAGSSEDCTRLELRHCSLDDGETYCALSYCWGNDSDQRAIEVNGQSLRVRSNLYQALQALCSSYWRNLPLWIDAICINQDDVAERSSQVQQMWRIFHRAQSVIAWLGAKSKHVRALRDSRPLDKDVWSEAMRDLSARSYWSRTWVIPECMQARELYFHCGDGHFLPYELLDWHRIDESTEKPEVFTTLVESLRSKSADRQHAFDSVLSGYASSQCSDRRDKIFALLGDPRVRGLQLSLEADYSMSTEELWLEVMKQHFQLHLGQTWQEHSRQSIPFAATLSRALAVDYTSKAYGEYVLSRLDFGWRPHGSSCIVAVFKTEGIMMVPPDMHEVVWSNLSGVPSHTKTATAETVGSEV